jgi:histidine ammonia-lyase
VQSIPVANGTEDHGSMSALAARRAAWAVSLAETVVAVELLTAAQAVDLRGLVDGHDVPLERELARAHDAVRAASPVLVEDRLLGDEIEAVLERVVRAGDQPG